jgi:hypothetical protein
MTEIKNKAGKTVRYRTICIDADLLLAIHKKAAVLEPTFGFRPTISQTIRHIFKKGGNND